MNISEFFVKRWEAEQPAFLKVLKAVPDGNLAYRPHERSTTAGNLAWQLVEEQQQLAELLDKGEIHADHNDHPATVAEIVSGWEKGAAELKQKLAKFDETKAAGPAKFFWGGKEVWTDTVGNMLWGYLFDMIHHRGQLSTYLRPMGGKVPAIYGPSADDTGS